MSDPERVKPTSARLLPVKAQPASVSRSWQARTVRLALSDLTFAASLALIGSGHEHPFRYFCLDAYLKRSDRDDRRLVAYGDQLGNGAVFKRLGFLAETRPNGATLVELFAGPVSPRVKPNSIPPWIAVG
jgi:hypothetical protein